MSLSMLDRVRKIDDFIFDSRFGAQAVSDFITYYTDVDNITQARICYLTSFVCNLLKSNHEDVWLQDVESATSFVACLVFIGMSEVARLLQPKEGFIHPYRVGVSYVLIRVFLLFLSLAAVCVLVAQPTYSNFLGFISICAMSTAFYLVTCITLPPRERFRLYVEA